MTGIDCKTERAGKARGIVGADNAISQNPPASTLADLLGSSYTLSISSLASQQLPSTGRAWDLFGPYAAQFQPKHIHEAAWTDQPLSLRVRRLVQLTGLRPVRPAPARRAG